MFLKIIHLLPFLVVFLVSLYFPSDGDLGWHLKYGEHFFKNGQILRDNIFSSEMPDYKWANTSWITDLISYLTYNHFGFLGLSILSALIITLTFYFFSKVARLDFYEKALVFPALLLFLSPVNDISFRGQLISLLLSGVLFYILTLFEDGKKKVLFLLIPLFILWVNLHGQWVVGLALLFLWAFFYLVKTYLEDKKKLFTEAKFIIPMLVFSSMSTMINPFGLEIHKTSLSHFNNPDLKSIIEYLPFESLSTYWWNQVILGFLIFFGVLFLTFSERIKQNLPKIGSLLVLYVLSFWVRRYSWTMYYLAMPLLKPVANFLKPDSEKFRLLGGSMILLGYLALISWLSNPIKRLENLSWNNFCDYMLCSEKSAVFFVKNQDSFKGEVITMYNWGGWLIYRYPEIKPSIDGRMHLWKDQKGYSGFSYYYNIEQNFRDVDLSKYDVVYMSPTKAVYQRLQELVKEGKWKIIYEDDRAGIFVRVLPT